MSIQAGLKFLGSRKKCSCPIFWSCQGCYYKFSLSCSFHFSHRLGGAICFREGDLPSRVHGLGCWQYLHRQSLVWVPPPRCKLTIKINQSDQPAELTRRPEKPEREVASGIWNGVGAWGVEQKDAPLVQEARTIVLPLMIGKVVLRA